MVNPQQKQPSVLKDLELWLVALLVIGSTTFLSVQHILPVELTQFLEGGYGLSLLGFLFHKLGLTSVPIASFEAITQQMVNVVNQAQRLHAQMLQAQQAPQLLPAVLEQTAAPAPVVSAPVAPVAPSVSAAPVSGGAAPGSPFAAPLTEVVSHVH